MLTTALFLLAMTAQDKLPDVQMGKAQLCFLVEPENAPKLSAKEDGENLADHLKFLSGLWEKRTALVVGPLMDAGKRKGIVLLDVESAEAAKKVLADDPYVRAGSLVVETHTWFFAKNYLAKGNSFMDLNQYWFGMLERPENPPTASEEQLNLMQDGHMANIQKMAKEGALLVAGPMVEPTNFRGIFVFKKMPKEEIEKLTADDPLIKAGRLKLTLFKWLTSKGSFIAEK